MGGRNEFYPFIRAQDFDEINGHETSQDVWHALELVFTFAEAGAVDERGQPDHLVFIALVITYNIVLVQSSLVPIYYQPASLVHHASRISQFKLICVLFFNNVISNL